ncbi:MAG: hypothetical protein IPM63_17050 [Acidobacteriota bacterium]|nr:MAG: hypothetical protein IPM63_17050 [Acidobacteriota bacterium]
MKCSETRRILRSGERPDERMLEHIRECGACARVAEREEFLTTLLKHAPAIDPPPDFDRTLMNKIESRRDSAASRTLVRPGILVPASAAVLLIAVLAIAFVLFRGQTAPEVAGPGIEEAPVTGSSETNVETGTNSEDLPDRNEMAGPVEGSASDLPAEPGAGSDPVEPAQDNEQVFEGGSRDLAAETPEDIVPPWADGTPRNVPDKVPARMLTPRELLAELGIEAELESGGWKVVSVRQGSIGSRAGVRKGDLIKALDGRPLTDAPLDAGGKRLQIVRGTRQMTLSIRP